MTTNLITIKAKDLIPGDRIASDETPDLYYEVLNIHVKRRDTYIQARPWMGFKPGLTVYDIVWENDKERLIHKRL